MAGKQFIFGLTWFSWGKPMRFLDMFETKAPHKIMGGIWGTIPTWTFLLWNWKTDILCPDAGSKRWNDYRDVEQEVFDGFGGGDLAAKNIKQDDSK